MIHCVGVCEICRTKQTKIFFISFWTYLSNVGSSTTCMYSKSTDYTINYNRCSIICTCYTYRSQQQVSYNKRNIIPVKGHAATHCWGSSKFICRGFSLSLMEIKSISSRAPLCFEINVVKRYSKDKSNLSVICDITCIR